MIYLRKTDDIQIYSQYRKVVECGLAMGDIGGSEDKYPENVSTCDKYCQNKVDSLSFCTENRSKCHLIDNHAKHFFIIISQSMAEC